MKLLFDQNLSPVLIRRVSDIFIGSHHVSLIGLGSVSDTRIWAYARQHGYTIVTKDADYYEIHATLGFPPKVI